MARCCVVGRGFAWRESPAAAGARACNAPHHPPPSAHTVLHPGDSAGAPVPGGRLVCGQHGWAYALDGRLAAAPRMGGATGFRAADFGLVPAGGAAVWGPIAFGCVAGRSDYGDAPVPASVAAALAAAGLPMSTADYDLVGRRRFIVRANWKVVAANFLDGGHHVPFAHPSLASTLDMDTYTSAVFEGGHSLQSVAPRPGPCGGRAASAAPSLSLYAFFFPCLMLNAYGPWLDANLVRPLGVGETAVDYVWWVKKSARPAPAAVAAALADSVAVQEEDTLLCASVQAGLGSPGAVPGVYAPRVETPLHAFHAAVAAAYRRGGLLGG